MIIVTKVKIVQTIVFPMTLYGSKKLDRKDRKNIDICKDSLEYHSQLRKQMNELLKESTLGSLLNRK